MRTIDQYRGREQTYFKHLVLERYLERVAYNIASFRPRIVYIDPFCGPWRSGSQDHSDSGFMIAIEALRKVRDGLNKSFEFRCFFVEDQNYAALERAVVEIKDVKIETRRGKFAENIREIVRFIGTDFWFAFIDPTGWTGFGMDDIRPILELRGAGRGEVLINFMFDYINRFIEWDDADTRAQMGALFGGGEWFREFQQLMDEDDLSREEALIELYKRRLKQAGDFSFVKSIRVLKPTSHRPYFHLVYATRNEKGVVELAKVERELFDQQETVRAKLKQEQIEAKAGPQLGFFAVDELAAKARTIVSVQRQKQLQRGRAHTYAYLKARKRVRYERLLAQVLQTSLVFESDVKDFIHGFVAEGTVAIERMNVRQRRVGAGHEIVFKENG